jgi:hypothetical protein
MYDGIATVFVFFDLCGRRRHRKVNLSIVP